jgi:broad specificity phosphatase PhoE
VPPRPTGVTPGVAPRLRERCFGEWQGLTLPEIAEGWPDAFARWRRGEPIALPGMESEEEVAERMAAAVEDAAEQADGRTVVLVSHGGAVRRGVGELLGWPDPVVHSVAGLGNCHWVELVRGARGWRLAAYNLGVHADVEEERVGAEDHAGEDADGDRSRVRA